MKKGGHYISIMYMFEGILSSQDAAAASRSWFFDPFGEAIVHQLLGNWNLEREK